MSHAESNTTASISVPVHGPVVVGSDKGGSSCYSSSHLSDDRFESITDLETRSFRDAGDMRSEAEGNGLYVILYLTETSAVPEPMSDKGTAKWV